jgi:hypothetical protein
MSALGAIARSADFQSAVSPIFNRQALDKSGQPSAIVSSAECNSAIQQISNLRYEVFP